MTTVDQKPNAMGRRAVAMLPRMIDDGAATPPAPFLTEPELVIRESCGRPRMERCRSSVSRSGVCRESVGAVAFTLIELLVVVAIIALLASLLLPALGGARELAYGMRCMSNQRQIGMAFTMYTEDCSGAFPWGRNPPGDPTTYNDGPWWFAVTAPYLEVRDVPMTHAYYSPGYETPYWCPKHLQIQDPPQPSGWWVLRWHMSYAYPIYTRNGLVALGGGLNVGANWRDYPPRRMAQVINPSGVMLLCETHHNNSSAIGLVPSWPTSMGRHGKDGTGTNFLFVDGHTQSFNNGPELLTQWTTYSGQEEFPFNIDLE